MLIMFKYVYTLNKPWEVKYKYNIIIGTNINVVCNVHVLITISLSTCIVMKQQPVHLVNFESACIYN